MAESLRDKFTKAVVPATAFVFSLAFLVDAFYVLHRQAGKNKKPGDEFLPPLYFVFSVLFAAVGYCLYSLIYGGKHQEPRQLADPLNEAVGVPVVVSEGQEPQVTVVSATPKTPGALCMFGSSDDVRAPLRDDDLSSSRDSVNTQPARCVSP